MRSIIALVSITIFAALSVQPTWAMSSRRADASSNKPTTEVTTPQGKVWVGISDHATSCGTKPPISFDVPEAKLTKAKIKIYKRKKLHDGKMRIMMCGADKGDMNGFLISQKDESKAISLGFQVVPE